MKKRNILGNSSSISLNLQPTERAFAQRLQFRTSNLNKSASTTSSYLCVGEIIARLSSGYVFKMFGTMFSLILWFNKNTQILQKKNLYINKVIFTNFKKYLNHFNFRFCISFAIISRIYIIYLLVSYCYLPFTGVHYLLLLLRGDSALAWWIILSRLFQVCNKIKINNSECITVHLQR